MALDGQPLSVREGCERLVKNNFENHPYQLFKLREFTPPEDGLLAEFLSTNKTLYRDPRRDKYPSLVLNGLPNSESHTEKVYEHIEANKGGMIGLYGTSGAGKTRSVLEYLSRNLGLYFVASTKHDAGSRDLEKALEAFRIESEILISLWTGIPNI
ncbi:expressed unknown protein [Seminavis robusta]|uniref:Uncharacterized protein n=1 Tax=Seminavis robusta TaxID=568900 RepID=A0A9N8HM10_9STRA|nr:expressed unknown protein [Seminavis robusta]|eukprot:Sro961_g225010.1 n/a (156) ;mRNA; f:29807-30274